MDEDQQMTILGFTAVMAIISLMIVVTVILFPKQEKAEETKTKTVIAEIAMPDGSVISGNVESYRSYGYDAWEIEINGITYITGRENIVIIKGGVGIEE